MSVSLAGSAGSGLVSIIMSSYNHEQYVRAALESVMAQTYPDIELLVLDDGSSDQTWAVVQSLEEACRRRFRRVQFRRQENQGICPALNRLLDEARGDYILRLDSDDLMKPHSVARQVSFLSAHPEYGLVVGDNEIIDGRGQVVYWDRKRRNTTDPARARYHTFAAFLRQRRDDLDFSSENFGDYMSLVRGNYIPNGYLVRRAIMDRIRYTTEAPTEDHYLMLQVAKLSRMKFLDEVLHSYRWHQHNTIKNRAKMRGYARKTLRHELELLRRAGDEARAKAVDEWLHQVWKKTRFRIGSCFEIYKITTYFEDSKYCLRLGSKSMVLMRRRGR